MVENPYLPLRELSLGLQSAQGRILLHAERILAPLFFTLAALMFGAPAIIHDFFPDLSRPTFLAIDAACIVLTAALTVAGIVAAMWENDPAAQWRRRARGFKRKVILRFAGVVLIVVFIGWFLLPTDPLKNQLPGSVHMPFSICKMRQTFIGSMSLYLV